MNKTPSSKTFYGLIRSFLELFQNPEARGKRQAEADLKTGKLAIKTYGQAVKWRPIYAELLQKEYNIVLESVSDGMVGSRKRREIHGYNSVSKRAIQRKHGAKVLDDLVEKAKQLSGRQDAIQ